MENTTNKQEFPLDFALYKLDENTKPLLYELLLKPDLNTKTFEGQIKIVFDQITPTKEIRLHSLGLQVTLNDPQLYELTEVPEVEQIKIYKKDGSEFLSGPQSIALSFRGSLNEQLRGFYKSTYKDENGNEKIIATTHFEPADARRAFPCFDEPDKKAEFIIALEIDKSLTGVSNWPVETKEVSGDKKILRFKKTIPMSTYLVAFVVGELNESEPRFFGNIPIKVICSPKKENLSSFALEMAEFSLRFFTNYFGIDYPGEKLDLIALPDFAFGAMENLGAVTFRETALLVDKDNAARVDLERVADVVAHELAHMWFGDLVTMKWWNGIWLNEAFATFMELLCVDAKYPDWQRWVTHGLSREAAMAIDGLASTRSIEYEVRYPEEAEGMFDVLTYQKGASVLRMLEQFLGETVFKNGINRYLKQHIYSNTQTEDLWKALEESSKESSVSLPVWDMMNSWIFQGGYPLITVELANNSLKISQQPFKLDPQGPSGNIGNKWLVPITVADKNSDFLAKHLLTKESDVIDLPNNVNIAVVNAGGWGYYRVRYLNQLKQYIFENLNLLNELELFNLFTDAFACAIAGYDDLTDFLKLCLALSKFQITDANIISVVNSALYMFEKILPDVEMSSLEDFTISVLSVPFSLLGWEKKQGEQDNDRTARATVISALGSLGKDPHVLAHAKLLFEQEISGHKTIDPDLLATVLNLVAQQGTPQDYEIIYNRYKNPLSPQYEQRHLFALGNFFQPNLIQRTLQMCLSEVRTQDAPFLLASMLANKQTQELTWEFIEDNYHIMVNKYPANALVRMLESVRTLYGTPEIAQRAKHFLSTTKVPSGQKAVAQTLERLEVNTKFSQRIEDHLSTLLREVKLS